MTKEVMDALRTKAFEAKTQEQWRNVMQEIKETLDQDNEDEKTREYIRNYCNNLLEKKKAYWAKYPPKEKKQFPVKKTVLLNEELTDKIGKYYDLLILEKKLELKNKFNIHID